jgi:MFS family permease
MAGTRSSSVRGRRRVSGALGAALALSLLIAPAGAQGPALVSYDVTPSSPVDTASGAGPDTTTPRSVTLTPEVSALDVASLDGIAALLPAQLRVRTVSSSGDLREITRTLTPLTSPDLLARDSEGEEPSTSTQPVGRRVVQSLGADVTRATAQAYLLDPALGLIAVGEPVELLHDVTVVIDGGGGSGEVTADPARLRCPTACQGNFVTGDEVTLTAVADPGSRFDRWEGCTAGAVPTRCSFVSAAHRTVVAHFALVTVPTEPPTGDRFHPLQVEVTGRPGARVVGDDVAIDCPNDCTAFVLEGESVTLRALGASTHDWSGACAGSARTCTVVMTSALHVTADFPATPPRRSALTVGLLGAKAGDGVTSDPPGIDCPPACFADFATGTAVRLTVEGPATGPHRFARWSGDCTGSAVACELTLTAPANVATATFTTKAVPPIVEERPGPPDGDPIAKLDDGCAISRSCAPTFTEIVAHLPAWPELLLGVLLLLFIAFPTALVDATIQDNYDRLAVSTRRTLRMGGKPSERWQTRPPAATAGMLLGYSALVAAIYWVADRPTELGLLAQLAWFLGAVVAFVATTLAGEWPKARRWRRDGYAGGFRDSTAYLALAVFSAAASWVFHLDPGYTFGVVAGYAAAKRNVDVEADANRFGAIAALGLAVGAMALWTALGPLELGERHSFGPVLLTTALSITIAAGFSRAAFTYLPFDFFEGSYLARRQHGWWWAIWAWGIVVAAAAVLSTGDDPARSDVFREPATAYVAAVVAVAIGCLSWLFWDHWRHPDRGTPPRLALVITSSRARTRPPRPAPAR